MHKSWVPDVAQSIGGVMSKDTKPPWVTLILALAVTIIVLVVSVKGAYIQLSMNGIG